MRARRCRDAARELGLSTRRIEQLARLHPEIVRGFRPLLVDVAALRELRAASPAALASAALRVLEFQWPKLADQHRTPEVAFLLLIDQLHPELRSARSYPASLRRLRERAGLPPDP